MKFCLELVHLKGGKFHGAPTNSKASFTKVVDEQIDAPRESLGGYCMNATDINDLHYEEVSNITP